MNSYLCRLGKRRAILSPHGERSYGRFPGRLVATPVLEGLFNAYDDSGYTDANHHGPDLGQTGTTNRIVPNNHAFLQVCCTAQNTGRTVAAKTLLAHAPRGLLVSLNGWSDGDDSYECWKGVALSCGIVDPRHNDIPQVASALVRGAVNEGRYVHPALRETVPTLFELPFWKDPVDPPKLPSSCTLEPHNGGIILIDNWDEVPHMRNPGGRLSQGSAMFLQELKRASQQHRVLVVILTNNEAAANAIRNTTSCPAMEGSLLPTSPQWSGMHWPPHLLLEWAANVFGDGIAALLANKIHQPATPSHVVRLLRRLCEEHEQQQTQGGEQQQHQQPQQQPQHHQQQPPHQAAQQAAHLTYPPPCQRRQVVPNDPPREQPDDLELKEESHCQPQERPVRVKTKRVRFDVRDKPPEPGSSWEEPKRTSSGEKAMEKIRAVVDKTTSVLRKATKASPKENAQAMYTLMTKGGSLWKPMDFLGSGGRTEIERPSE